MTDDRADLLPQDEEDSESAADVNKLNMLQQTTTSNAKSSKAAYF